jgi:hypothetical protein
VFQINLSDIAGRALYILGSLVSGTGKNRAPEINTHGLSTH